MKNSFTFSSLVLVPVLAVLAACGGGGGGSSTTPATTTPTLQSIIVTPPSPTLAIGTSQLMTATAVYSDNKNTVLTTGVTWAAKGSAILNVFSNGTVTAKGIGTETVTATFGGVSGSTDVTVKAPWVGVVAAGLQTFARKADGTLYAWGSNQQGQLGDSTTTDRLVPTQVNGAVTTWAQVAVGDQFAVAIRKDGTLWSWGYNSNGQLGDGTTINHASPAKIGTATDWTFVAAGKRHAFAINKAGVLFGWGGNFNGQLGDGTTVGKLVPTKITVAGVTPVPVWLSVSAGETHTLGVTTALGLWGWGGNLYGQVGNAGFVDVTAPTKIGNGTATWTAVSAGAFHSSAIRADGTLFAWGLNTNGQVGNNGSLNQTTPVQVTPAANWAVVSAGGAHTMAVRTDGTLWGWGANDNGQLGDGLGLDTNTPNQIGTATNWSTVSAGALHTFGLRTDSSMWGWGNNSAGQLGNNTKTSSQTPVTLP